ncbi:MAG: hypothetical protein ABSA68_09535 [Xanthobacteraceae bacterium]|jgi:hypothetical protein
MTHDMSKMKFIAAIMAALIATPSAAQPIGPGRDKERSHHLDALSRVMTWSVTNSTGHDLSLSFYSQNSADEWTGFTIKNNSTQGYKLTCQSGEQICYGLTASNERYWGVGSDAQHLCTDCCWICGEADPLVNLAP